MYSARIILGLADGYTWERIESQLNTTGPTIWRCKKRFEKERMVGLEARHKGSKPRIATPAVQARVARRTLQAPTDGSTHWSCRKMAAALGFSKTTVQRMSAQARLEPHRLESYMASDDSRFEEKAADIIGLYMNPPQHAAVFCVDERPRFKLWTGASFVAWGERSGTVSSTSGTGRCRSTRHSISRLERCKVWRRRATPAPSSYSSSKVWSAERPGPRSFISCSTICPRIRPRMSNAF